MNRTVTATAAAIAAAALMGLAADAAAGDGWSLPSWLSPHKPTPPTQVAVRFEVGPHTTR